MEKEQEAQKFVRKLFKWRRNASVIHNGNLLHFAPDNHNEVYVMFRYNDAGKVMVIFNKNIKEVVLDLDIYEEILGTTLSGKDVLSDTIFNTVQEITVPAKTSMVIEVD